MGTLGAKAIQKVSGRAWDRLRAKFMTISESLLEVSEDALGELTTIYVKFSIGTEASSPVYAVVWVKNSKSLTVGYSMPEDFQDAKLGPPPQGMRYQGLTHYFTITAEEEVPDSIGSWAEFAFEHVRSQQ